jgi:hypothetical protein
VLFSAGFPSSEEVLSLVQLCALGLGPEDPCFTNTLGGPTGDAVWDPAIGMTERGSLMVTVNSFDRFFAGVRGPELWAWATELGVGLPSPIGQQLSLEPSSAGDPGLAAALAELEAAAAALRIVAKARPASGGTWAFDPGPGRWRLLSTGALATGAELLALAAGGEVITVTALPGRNVVPAGPPQPLLWPDPPAAPQGFPNLPRPPAGGSATLHLAASSVAFGARVLVDGAVCAACSVVLAAGGGAVDVTLDPVPAPGPHVLQVANPRGLESNELLFVAH